MTGINRGRASPLHLLSLDKLWLPHAVALDLKVLGGIWSLEGYQQELQRTSSSLLGVTTTNNSLPHQPMGHSAQLLGMGCLWSILDEAHITLLAVDPKFQRQGVGHTVLYGLLAVARQRNLARATLEARSTNDAAVALYQKFGFQIAGRRRNYYAPGEDALILWRSKLQTPAFAQALQQWHQDSQDRLTRAGWPPLVLSL